MSRRLEVRLHDQPIGTLSETPDGGSEFRFHRTYRDLAPRPVLGQKFEDDLDRIYRSRKGQRLPDFFANLIPEPGGKLREVIEDAGALEAGDDLALLTFVGEDLPGAVVVYPSEEPEAWSGAQKSPKLQATQETPPPGEEFRFSLAGVQLKFSMLLQEEKLTLPARGRSGEWIVKFDSPTFPHLPENEYSMLEWAQAAGFDVPPRHLLGVESLEGFSRQYALQETKVLAIQRYDRTPEGRVHQEDFAQVVGLPPRRKYDQITYEAMARLVHRFMDAAAVEEWVRRLTFVLASGNNDAHLKNWSFIYPDQIRAQWSPLYDQVSTIAWQAPARQLSLKLVSTREFNQIDRQTFRRLAERAELDPKRTLVLVDETLEKLRRSWKEIKDALPLPIDHARALQEHWKQVPILQQSGTLD